MQIPLRRPQPFDLILLNAKLDTIESHWVAICCMKLPFIILLFQGRQVAHDISHFLLIE